MATGWRKRIYKNNEWKRKARVWRCTLSKREGEKRLSTGKKWLMKACN